MRGYFKMRGIDYELILDHIIVIIKYTRFT